MEIIFSFLCELLLNLCAFCPNPREKRHVLNSLYSPGLAPDKVAHRCCKYGSFTG